MINHDSQGMQFTLRSMDDGISKETFDFTWNQVADIQVTGFENTNFQNDSFDVAVGNMPFGDLSFPDTQYGTTKLDFG